jgi:hypothetical protein
MFSLLWAIPDAEPSFCRAGKGYQRKRVSNKDSIDFKPRFRKAALLEIDSIRLARA